MPTIVANFVSSISTKKKGDFASKMWASYTQLNPGVYSEAIATEFKRRMKPDYVDSAGTGYYYNTFGPSGLNKTTADWIYMLLVNGANTSTKYFRMTGTTTYNINGVVSTGTAIPLYEAFNGIITITSINPGPVTRIQLASIGVYGTLPSPYYSPLGSSLLDYSGIVTNGVLGIKVGSMANQSVPFTIACLGAGATGLTNGWRDTITLGLSSFSFSGHSFPTTEVDKILSWFNTFYAANTPTRSLTLNLSGATMGIPTGAGSNTDLLGILAKFTTAGFTATIIVRTV